MTPCDKRTEDSSGTGVVSAGSARWASSHESMDMLRPVCPFLGSRLAAASPVVEARGLKIYPDWHISSRRHHLFCLFLATFEE